MGPPPYPGSPVSPVKKYLALSTALLTLAVTGLLLFGGPADARAAQFQARLRDADGRVVGTVRFEVDDHAMHVDATLRRNSYVTPDAFHGFHLHANADPANGQGCQADPDAPPATWFVSADGHFSETGQEHGEHHGDLPSPLVMADGTARLAFSTTGSTRPTCAGSRSSCTTGRTTSATSRWARRTRSTPATAPPPRSSRPTRGTPATGWPAAWCGAPSSSRHRIRRPRPRRGRARGPRAARRRPPSRPGRRRWPRSGAPPRPGPTGPAAPRGPG